MDALQETITQIKEHGGEHREWMAQFREHLNITELERSIVVALIDRILIYKDNRVEVRFRFADEFAYSSSMPFKSLMAASRWSSSSSVSFCRRSMRSSVRRLPISEVCMAYSAAFNAPLVCNLAMI